jgi:hypothetical protein
MDNIKYTIPETYSITEEASLKIREAVKLKRNGKYEEAKKIYRDIFIKYGASGELYVAMAKNLACNMEYELAIELFKLANESCINEYQQSNPNIEDHIFELENRNNVPEKEFLNYIKTIAGNPNYEFPREYILNTDQ